MLSEQEIRALIETLTGWERADVGGKPGISKTFQRANFMDGLSFVTRLAELAEKANHHPDVVLTYPRVTVSLTTHDAGGLTEKDFGLAKQIDEVA